MSDLAQNLTPASPNYGDLLLVNGALVVIEGLDEVRQSLLQKLQTFQGEAFLATDLGVPYVQQVFQKGISEDVLEGIFRQAILEDARVLSIIDFTLKQNAQRQLTLNFTARTADGSVSVSTVV